jgi:prepilin-type N-terminal cleavage/methylation domain-containing protein
MKKLLEPKLLNQQGFSLMEILVASAVLSIVAVMASRGIGIAYEALRVADVKEAHVNLSSNILNTMATNASLYQVDYSTRNPSQMFPDKESLTRAWDSNGRDASIADCPECRGRYDFVIKPSSMSGELNVLHLYIYHPDFPGSTDESKFKKYKRLVGNR